MTILQKQKKEVSPLWSCFHDEHIITIININSNIFVEISPKRKSSTAVVVEVVVVVVVDALLITIRIDEDLAGGGADHLNMFCCCFCFF